MTQGEQIAAQIIDEYAVVAMAALGGDLEALKTLVATAAQCSYTAGFGAAASTTAGFPL